jgi:hypothetical protein
VVCGKRDLGLAKIQGDEGQERIEKDSVELLSGNSGSHQRQC